MTNPASPSKALRPKYMGPQFFIVIPGPTGKAQFYLAGDYMSWTADRDKAQAFVPGAALNALWEELRRYGAKVIPALRPVAETG